jgi:acetyl/propionyl-CoA carboxylase alpha subunit
MTRLSVTVAGHIFQVELSLPPGSAESVTVLVDGKPLPVRFPDISHPEWLIIDDQPLDFCVDDDYQWISSSRGMHQLEIQNLDQVPVAARPGEINIKAPIPGKIAQVLVDVGDAVSTNQLLLVLEAMKMENEIRASTSGSVRGIHVAPGERVIQEQLLIEIDV